MCPKEFVHRPGGSHTVSLASGTMEASATEWMKPQNLTLGDTGPLQQGSPCSLGNPSKLPRY